MRIADMNWMQVEAYLAADDRCVLPIGSTEQHAQLSLCVDAILAERVAVEAAEPLGVPVYPAMPFGLAPYFLAFPGTISLQVETLLAVVRDLVASVHRAGFRRVLIVNGHGGNMPVGALAQELMAGRQSLSLKFHSWWNAPKTWAKVQEIDPSGTHAQSEVQRSRPSWHDHDVRSCSRASGSGFAAASATTVASGTTS